MEITVANTPSGTIVSLSGELDVVTCEDVGRRLEALVAAGNHHLVLDGTAMTYVSSAGLKTILHVYKLLRARHGTLRIVAANEFVKRVFRTTGFTTLVPVFATLDEALAAPSA